MDFSQLEFLTSSEGFLGIGRKDAPESPGEANAIIVPYGLEATMLRKGAGKGPKAILAASHGVEPFDEEHWGEPYRSIGLATLDLKSIHTDVDGALDVLEDIIATLLKAEKFPLVLGGEHSVTAGAVRAYVEKYPNLSILHFGAAAHLKDGDMGQFNSHASSLRRCLDNPDVRLVSCGVRNLSAEEAGYLSQNPERIRIYWAKNQEEWDMEEIAAGLKGRQVYISFDVGAFDPSFMPASGTPEPGGLRWVDAMGIIRAASRLASIVGADIVGLTPIENLYAPDFIAAKLAYKILGYAFSNNY